MELQKKNYANEYLVEKINNCDYQNHFSDYVITRPKKNPKRAKIHVTPLR